MDTAITGEKNDRSDLLRQMEAIVAEHETALLRYATRILDNPVAAEDVVQNVFVKLFENWKKGTRPSGKLRSWLYRVTHNEAIDFIRHESRLSILHQKQSEENVNCPDGVHCVESEAERRTMVLEHVRKLHPTEQQVLLLRLEEGLSYKEIAEVTGRTEGNVGCILHNAVLKIAEKVKKGIKAQSGRGTE
ncbi:MAG: sigma-70 family RNA polymerase sigma factor [Kiritimatiellae bacterium]|nr:sigma-70 family RNA polymerase sigma factor [Kiritimatiellia bacterium]MDD5519806.1 sigma-70 family RNA polymerase sigma factor [Kiritimatiellia bacterium]